MTLLERASLIFLSLLDRDDDIDPKCGPERGELTYEAREAIVAWLFDAGVTDSHGKRWEIEKETRE